ncbi:MAG TPA: ABC transporter ATP-binding protein [Asticcacaulis sp.]|nr:ABC transporter ATP-binding protein [Asticcacaulis sp.]
MADKEIFLGGVDLSYPLGPFLRGSIKEQLLGLFLPRRNRLSRSSVQALRNINLKITHGERLGIIGRNGSGKSTLLRTIAGVYPPSRGTVQVKGHIQSIFDIGLGFESESTGRENIMYRGLVMGSDPATIRARTQEIVDFADIGEFIDLPMRTYSAGMFVRLAFAISTYLEGEILLIDEVFGAGDANFAHKAVSRIRSLVDAASIVVFVSHDLGTIREVCTRVIWVDGGVIKMEGDPTEVTEAYLSAAG